MNVRLRKIKGHSSMLVQQHFPWPARFCCTYWCHLVTKLSFYTSLSISSVCLPSSGSLEGGSESGHLFSHVNLLCLHDVNSGENICNWLSCTCSHLSRKCSRRKVWRWKLCAYRLYLRESALIVNLKMLAVFVSRREVCGADCCRRDADLLRLWLRRVIYLKTIFVRYAWQTCVGEICRLLIIFIVRREVAVFAADTSTTQTDMYTGFPRLLESPIFFLKIPGPGKSWKITLVLESREN